MKQLKYFLLVLLSSLVFSPAQAFFTEVGASYGHDRKNFDANNYTESESLTGELSFYFMERVALELSYTDATGLLKQKASSTDPARTTQQKTQIFGADLILMFADRKAFLQPFIKGGGARISRSQEIKIEGFDTQTLDPETATVPSYGLGVKVLLTEQLSFKFSYSVWRTPIGGGVTTDDSSLRAGISWLF